MNFLTTLINFSKDLEHVLPTKPKPFTLYQRLLARGDLKAGSEQADKFRQGFLDFFEAYPQFYEPDGLLNLPNNYSICYGGKAEISIPLQKIVQVNLTDLATIKAISNHLVLIASIVCPGSVPQDRLSMISQPTQEIPNMPPGLNNIFKAIGDKMAAMATLGPAPEGEREVKRFQKVLSEVVLMDEFGDMMEMFIGTVQNGGAEAEEAMAQNPMFAMFSQMAPQMFGGAPAN